MKDSGLKKSIKWLALIRYRIDLGFTRFILKLQGEPAYEMRGRCCNCGECCKTPMIHTFALFFYLKSLRWLCLTWHKKINGFEFISENRIKRIFIFRCTHFDPETKLCDAYSSRPGICRDYPKNILYNTPPDFLPECTFSALSKNAEKINETLDKLDLSPEKLKKIKKDFFSEGNLSK